MGEKLRRLPAESRWISAIFLLSGALSAAAFFSGSEVGAPTLDVYFGYFTNLGLLAPPTLTLVLTFLLARAAVLRVKSPLTECRLFLSARLGSADRAVGTFGPILLLPVLMAAFTTLKQLMPLVRPFVWDDTLAELGRLLFFGYQPWQLTHAVFGSPMATLIIDRIYTLWVPLLLVAVLCFSLFAPLDLRARFFIAFAATWILVGGIGAFIFSSAGPCYTKLVGASSAGAFEELMARLHAVDAAGYSLGALHWQNHLWEAHNSRTYGFGLGISAMPSMHNAITFLYVLSAARARPLIRFATWLFAAVILIGSVHLGWHYLVDGLVAWAAAAAIWWAAGAYLRWARYGQGDEGNDQQERSGLGAPENERPGLVAV